MVVTMPGLSGRTDRLEALYRAEADAMARLAFLLTGDRSAAQDLVQDAFVQISVRMNDPGRVPDNPAGYLRTTVVNLCNSWHRRRKVEVRHASTEVERLQLGPELDETWAKLAGLPAKTRTALVLRYYLDLPVDGVAEAMGIAPSAARSAIHRGIKVLRKEYGHVRG